ncbi:MAG: hypothetical protein RL722_1226 [Pseudomonadota bacterium]|jgi:DNA-binding CsgD family transcriptional regulator
MHSATHIHTLDATSNLALRGLVGSAGLSHSTSRPLARPAHDGLLIGLMRRVLDELDSGVVMVDGQGDVVFFNRSARHDHLGSGLQHLQVGERLAAGTSVETGELLRAVRDAVQLSRRSLVRLGTGMRHCIAVVPVAADASQEPNAGHALLLFGRRQACAPISIAFFARTFGLTPTESQVLEALCQGEPPARIAANNGVAVSTIRTQLTAIRQKTQTGSLRELVRQVSTLPPIVGLSFGDATH